MGPGGFGEQFGFRAGNEGVFVHGHFQTPEIGGADDVLERFALAAALDELAEAIGFPGGQRAVEIEVQLHAGKLEEVGEEEFDLEARGFDAFFGEKIGAALDGFKDRHGRKIRSGGED